MEYKEARWAKQYDRSRLKPVYPTEWVIRTIAGANYPRFKYDKTEYKGKRILDTSCGDGRNLQLLLNLGFEVYATETNQNTVEMLREKYPNVQFSVGLNHNLPFDDHFFDYVLSCGAFYYLADGTSFNDNLIELHRIMKQGGVFYANMARPDSYVLQNAEVLENGEYRIAEDPHGLRNGLRWQVVNSKEGLVEIFSPYFEIVAVGEALEDYYGYVISNYLLICTSEKLDN